MNEDTREYLITFLKNYYRDQVGYLAQRYPREQRSLVIDYSDIVTFDLDLAEDFDKKPDTVIELLEDALYNYDLPADVDLRGARVRVRNVDPQGSVADPNSRIRDPGDFSVRFDAGKPLGIQGQVSQVTDAKPYVQEAAFECLRCGTRTYIPQSGGKLQDPHECQGCERQGPFNLDETDSEWDMRRMVRLQKPPERSGGLESHTDITLTGDLAEAPVNGEPLKGGERVTATGVLTVDTDDMMDNSSTEGDWQFETLDVAPEDGGVGAVDWEDYQDELEEIEEADDPIQVLVDNIAPHLYGEKYEPIKRALALQVIGTNKKSPQDGPTYRGDIHCLLLGDPSTGKSDLVLEMTNLAPRGKFKSGEGLAKAGITAAAVRDGFGGDGWSLKAGLLVLASGGLAGIDEIDKAADEAVHATHSALENQVVTVSKAGIDATLPAETSLLASGNPIHGRFDTYEPLGEQIDLPPALMSRFDLMFMLPDRVDPEKDREIATHMTKSWDDSAQKVHPNHSDPEGSTGEREYPEEVLTAYIAKAKQTITPVWTDDEVNDLLVNFYVDLREEGSDADAPVPVTARKLQALKRLSESAARARMHEVVQEEDVELAIDLVRTSLEDVGINPETGDMDADIVETGTSKSQRDRIKRYKAVIRDVSEEHDGDGAPRQDVVDLLIEMGDSKKKVNDELENLRRKGEVYEPRTDWVSAT